MPPMDDLPLFRWRPPAEIVIFPTARNRPKVQRTALAAASSKHPENTIKATLDRLRASLQRKGLPLEMIARDVAELESALRTQVEFLLTRHWVAK
ncbi:DUF6074 family protein [Rhodopseudomonas sp. RCAM05734]|uniref:DUF6074 family protein n=1 Tax=Rhodopseudomonas sp. RCAM05734 TaxID=3457549 RepID=UPI00404508B8